MNSDKDAPCGCAQHFTDMLRTHKFNSSLSRVTCRNCGKQFMTNVETDLCFDCKNRGA